MFFMYFFSWLGIFLLQLPANVANPRFRRSHHWFVVSPAEVLSVSLGCCHDRATLQEPWEHTKINAKLFHVPFCILQVYTPPKKITQRYPQKFYQPPCLVFFHESSRVFFSPRYQLRWGAVKNFLGKQILRENSFALSEEVGEKK